MKTLKARWKLYLNLLLLSAIMITSFQNCSSIDIKNSLAQRPAPTPIGVEIVTE
jgi:hypothetical protein